MFIAVWTSCVAEVLSACAGSLHQYLEWAVDWAFIIICSALFKGRRHARGTELKYVILISETRVQCCTSVWKRLGSRMFDFQEALELNSWEIAVNTTKQRRSEDYKCRIGKFCSLKGASDRFPHWVLTSEPSDLVETFRKTGLGVDSPVGIVLAVGAWGPDILIPSTHVKARHCGDYL